MNINNLIKFFKKEDEEIERNKQEAMKVVCNALSKQFTDNLVYWFAYLDINEFDIVRKNDETKIDEITRDRIILKADIYLRKFDVYGIVYSNAIEVNNGDIFPNTIKPSSHLSFPPYSKNQLTLPVSFIKRFSSSYKNENIMFDYGVSTSPISKYDLGKMLSMIAESHKYKE